MGVSFSPFVKIFDRSTDYSGRDSLTKAEPLSGEFFIYFVEAEKIRYNHLLIVFFNTTGGSSVPVRNEQPPVSMP